MRIAYFSPINPQPSGISDYSEALLPHLAERVEQIDLFLEDYYTSAQFNTPNLRIRPWREFEADQRAGRYSAVLYHIGNNPFHVYIYDLAMRIPGVVVLHEFNLHYLVAHATVGRGDWEAYFQQLEHDAGPTVLEVARQAQEGKRQLDYDNIPMNRSLLERSQAVVVHSDYMVGLLREAGFHLPVRRIPHGVEISSDDRVAARRLLAERTGWDLNESNPVFGVFGFLKPYKRIHESLRAFARLKAEKPQIRLTLAGEEHPHYPLRALISELGLEESVRMLGYLPMEQFNSCMAAVDFCINLRRPTAGETSGSFMRALAMGKPTLVSAIGSFMEFPDDTTFKIPVDDKEERWLYEYMKTLLEQPDLARAVGGNGRDYVRRRCRWPKVADQYAEWLARGAQVLPAPEIIQNVAPAAASENGKLPRTAPSEEEIAEYIVGFSHASKVMEEYVLTHLRRLVRTVQFTPPGGREDRLLELGCYLQMTPALKRYRGYGEICGAYLGRGGKHVDRTVRSVTGEEFSCRVDLFDAEKDPFPYSDGTFRAVLCCELIEHLSSDPMHMLAEINRVLTPGGHLLLTTPNIASFRSVNAVLHGYHPGMFPAYMKPSADGAVDPRHSREYAPREVALLAEAAGFRVELLETGAYSRKILDTKWTRQFLESNHLSTQLRDEVIYCLARKVGPVQERWPKELYCP